MQRIIATCQQWPLLTGTACAAAKGALADVTAQELSGAAEYRPGRTAAFAVWSALYCGVGVYSLYSVLLPRIWPTTGVVPSLVRRHVAFSVLFDNLLATPFLCMPTYYLCRIGLASSSEERRRPGAIAAAALRVYAAEARDVLRLSWSLWFPIHCLTFTVVPIKLRTHFVALCSFVTLMCMSCLQGRLETRREDPRAQ